MDARHGDVREAVIRVDGLVDHDDADAEGNVEAKAEGGELFAVLRLVWQEAAGGWGWWRGCHGDGVFGLILNEKKIIFQRYTDSDW